MYARTILGQQAFIAAVRMPVPREGGINITGDVMKLTCFCLALYTGLCFNGI